MEISPIIINSALLSAQNRVRLYWTNIASEKYGLFGDLRCGIRQPNDKEILLSNVLEDEVNEKYYLSDKMLKYFSNRAANFNQGKVNIREEQGKASCLTSSMASCDISDNFIKISKKGKVKTNQDKASCFTAGANSGGNHSDMDLIYRKDVKCVAMRGRNPDNPKSRKAGLPTKQMIEPREDDKTNCLTTVQKDNLVYQLNTSTESGGKQPYQQNRVYADFGKSPCLDTDSNRKNVKLSQGSIRRLTPTECERLQTVPDGYTDHVSDTQRYKMLGNGWTVDVIVYILEHMDVHLSPSRH